MHDFDLRPHRPNLARQMPHAGLNSTVALAAVCWGLPGQGLRPQLRNCFSNFNDRWFAVRLDSHRVQAESLQERQHHLHHKVHRLLGHQGLLDTSNPLFVSRRGHAEARANVDYHQRRRPRILNFVRDLTGGFQEHVVHLHQAASLLLVFRKETAMPNLSSLAVLAEDTPSLRREVGDFMRCHLGLRRRKWNRQRDCCSLGALLLGTSCLQLFGQLRLQGLLLLGIALVLLQPGPQLVLRAVDRRLQKLQAASHGIDPGPSSETRWIFRPAGVNRRLLLKNRRKLAARVGQEGVRHHLGVNWCYRRRRHRRDV